MANCPPEPPMPTAQASLAEIATTPNRSPAPRPGTMLHCAPSQWKITVCAPPWRVPTAQASFAEDAETARNPMPLILGLGTMVQLAPRQCSVNVSYWPELGL